MKAIRVAAHGGPEALALTEVDTPRPGPGEILVRHAAIGVNFIDTYHRSGLYPQTMPSGLGLEAAGVVEQAGEGARFSVGDRVAYASGPIGAYAEAHVVKAARAVRLPDAVSFEAAASSLLRGMTAEYCLRRCAPAQAGQTVLIHAAAGGVGLIMVQWAKALGVRTIGTVGSAAKAELASSHGCDEVLMADDPDLVAKVRDLTGGAGVPIVYDGVGAATFDISLASLARRGILVTFGNASGPLPPFPPMRLSTGGSLYITRPTLADYTHTTEELDATAAAYFAMVESGAVKVEIGGKWALAEAAEAHRALEGRRTTGGVVLIP